MLSSIEKIIEVRVFFPFKSYLSYQYQYLIIVRDPWVLRPLASEMISCQKKRPVDIFIFKKVNSTSWVQLTMHKLLENICIFSS